MNRKFSFGLITPDDFVPEVLSYYLHILNGLPGQTHYPIKCLAFTNSAGDMSVYQHNCTQSNHHGLFGVIMEEGDGIHPIYHLKYNLCCIHMWSGK